MEFTRRSILRASAFAAVLPAVSRLPLCGSAAAAEGAAEPAWRHGLSLFGDIKYPADFKHFNYVNAQAPQGGMVRQSVKCFQVKHVLVGVFELRVRIAAGGTGIGDAIDWIVAAQQPTSGGEGLRDFPKQLSDVPMWQ